MGRNETANEFPVYYPDTQFGPDIISKCDGHVYVVQVKFVASLYYGGRVDAAKTTDRDYFYRSRMGMQQVLKGFEKKRETARSLINAEKLKRVAVLQTQAKAGGGTDDGVTF